ncbi:MAG: phage major capsid protein [Chloroflexi bacterium]|nr:phage major capsid protein [Chloroflexota bacterium]
MLTLAESAKLTQDQLRAGVIETIIEESPMLRYLRWLDVQGNSFAYNQEATLSGAQFYPVNALWTEGTMTFTRKTASLAILGGDADVDNFIHRTRSRETDQRAVQTAAKAKDVSRKWEQTTINGAVATDANSFDGLATLAVAGQTITAGANGAALTLALLDQLVDAVKGGKPHLLLMSKRTRRALKALLQASAHYVEQGADQFGRQVMFYDGIPVEVSDYQPDTETQGSSNLASSIYALQFSDADGLVGLTNGGLDVIDVGQLESKDASRVRLRWYVGLALLRDSAIARLKGVL